VLAGRLHLDSLLRHDRAPGAAWRPVFPNRCLLFATLGLCDFVITSVILSLGGEECNQIANWLLEHAGLAGAAVFKFTIVALVIAMVEWITRRDAAAGRRLANYALVISAVPVAVGGGLLGIFAFMVLA
jgi:hypothetical protein